MIMRLTATMSCSLIDHLLEMGGRMGENKDMTYFAENPDYSEMVVALSRQWTHLN